MQLKRFCVFLLTLLFLVSCIREAPLSPEADIVAFSFPENIALSDAIMNGTNIAITVRKGVDLTAIVPTITVTEGATIHPAADEPRDFTSPVTYTVVSQDQRYQQTYTVQAITYSFYKYDFEDWEQPSSFKYETPVEYDQDGNKVVHWDSSNRGVVIYNQFPTAAEFPVHSTVKHATGALAAEMVTDVGPGNILGVMYIPVVAGSLFTGVMDPLSAMIDPLLATQFGQPCDEKPLRMRGKYIYKPGTGDYLDPKGNVLPGVKDSCAVYTVFFKIDKDVQMLNGANIRNHPNIVAMAMMPDEQRAGSEGNDFVEFDIPFVYRSDEEVDFEKNAYKMAVIFSSSFYGDRYEGTPGSRLIVDDVEIITER